MNIDLLLTSLSKHILLTDKEKDFFCSLLNTRFLSKNSFLLREGDVCRNVSFITKGCLKTYHLDDKGVEHITDFSIEEWWAEDLYSFFTETGSRTTIKAIEDTDIIQISKTNLELLYQEVPKFERFFRILFQNAYIAHRDQIQSMLSDDAEQRYIRFIKKKPYALVRFSQQDIASYLGITPQFLSAMKKKIGPVNVD